MFDSLSKEAASNIGTVVRADVARGLPISNACLDAVFAGEIIEHLVDTDSFIAEIARVLRPGGHTVITTPNLASFENRLRLLAGIYPLWVDHRVGGEGHVRAYTPRVLKKQLAQHGLVVTAHVGNWVPFLPQLIADDVREPWLAHR